MPFFFFGEKGGILVSWNGVYQPATENASNAMHNAETTAVRPTAGTLTIGGRSCTVAASGARATPMAGER